MTLHALVLGSAAGGGFPQWNCACRNCAGVREGRPELRARTQDSVAISGDGERWFLLNASPDVLFQVQQHRQLWPKSFRGSPIAGVVLTNGDLDHVLGLLQLRESQPLALYATARVLAGLRENAALRTLERFEGHLVQRELVVGEEVELAAADGGSSGLFLRPDTVAGKPPLHLMGSYEPSPSDNVALRVRAGESTSLVYASAIANARAALPLFEGCGALLLDGTFWSEEELPDMGVPMGPARTMAHQPIGGADGSLEALVGLQVPRRIYTHLNNTNPVLDERSPERARVVAAGWEIATDGLTLRLD
jgi:pyrroloquinoline quinone biosynthesis protein B